MLSNRLLRTPRMNFSQVFRVWCLVSCVLCEWKSALVSVHAASGDVVLWECSELYMVVSHVSVLIMRVHQCVSRWMNDFRAGHVCGRICSSAMYRRRRCRTKYMYTYINIYNMYFV
jgi:hypothetical protein